MITGRKQSTTALRTLLHFESPKPVPRKGPTLSAYTTRYPLSLSINSKSVCSTTTGTNSKTLLTVAAAIEYTTSLSLSSAGLRFTAMPSATAKPIVIREVWTENLEFEFLLIRSAITHFPFISMDTEFPGVIIHSIAGERPPKHRTSLNHYFLLKANVDIMKLIQLGLTLTDSDGNLPDFGTASRYIWQFNFKDFDVSSDPHVHSSVDLLRRQGIDFEKNREIGVEAMRFGELLMSSGLVCSDSVSWVTFHSGYDFGYLLKILTRQRLPAQLRDFMVLMRVFFGRVYDVKYLIRFCNSLYGGLDQVASALGMDRVVGKSHQAGSDSLLTWGVFQRIRDVFFNKLGPEKHSGQVLRGPDHCLSNAPDHLPKQMHVTT
ncbi:hypothetical protein Dimus_006958 [Dionaea muscipula]